MPPKEPTPHVLQYFDVILAICSLLWTKFNGPNVSSTRGLFAVGLNGAEILCTFKMGNEKGKRGLVGGDWGGYLLTCIPQGGNG